MHLFIFLSIHLSINEWINLSTSFSSHANSLYRKVYLLSYFLFFFLLLLLLLLLLLCFFIIILVYLLHSITISMSSYIFFKNINKTITITMERKYPAHGLHDILLLQISQNPSIYLSLYLSTLSILTILSVLFSLC